MPLIATLARRAASLLEGMATPVLIGKRGWGAMFTRTLMQLSIGAGIVPSGREVVRLAQELGGSVSRNTVNRTRNSLLGIAEGQVFNPKAPLDIVPEGIPKRPTEQGDAAVWWAKEGNRQYIIRVTPYDRWGRPLVPRYVSIMTDKRLTWQEAINEAEERWSGRYFEAEQHELHFAPDRVLVTRGPREADDWI